MQGNPHDQHEAVEHLDADAVCEACGNVNPEGTLLCKTCGNNLRDQRARRMQGGGPVVAADPSVSIANIARGVLILFGICVVLWAAFNVATIESWLLSGVQTVEAKGENAISPESFWDGPDAARYDDLFSSLEEHALTIEEAGIVPPGSPLPSLTGRYILKRSTGAAVSPVGSAIVESDGTTCHFVARLAGGTEVRGSAQKTSDTMIQAYRIGILDPDGVFTDAYGYAQVQPTGELNCSGLFGEYETPASIVAIPVPSDGQPESEAASEPVPEDAAADASTESDPAAQ